MSVEDAREAMRTAVTRWDREMRAGDAEGGERMLDDAIDRLILEVQAEMPCYGWPCEHNADDARGGYIETTRKRCPSCTARMKLKETADAR